MRRAYLAKICLLTILCLAADLHAETLSLTLDQALLTTLKENSIIDYSAAGVDIAEHALRFEEGLYDPSLNMYGRLSRQEWNSENNSGYEIRRDDYYTANIQKKHSYGGTSTIGALSSRFGEGFYNPKYLSREYRTGIYLRHDLPLLRNAGRELTNLDIRKADIQKATAEQDYAEARSQILFQVFQDFFLRHRAARRLDISRQIRESTKEMFLSTREQVKMQRLPLTDHKKIEAQLLAQDSRIGILLNDERQLEYQLLFSIFNDARAREISHIALPADPENDVEILSVPSLEETLKQVRDTDINLIRLQDNLQLLEADLIRADDGLKPNLNLGVEVGLDGYDRDSWSDSGSDFSNGNYRFLVDVYFSLPWKNTQAISKKALVEGQIRQSNILLKNRESEIQKIVHQLYDNLATAKKVREMTRGLVAIARENLANEVERLRAEKSTVVDTLSYQSDLDNAELTLLESEIEYILLLGELRYLRREMEVFMGSGAAVHANRKS